MGGPGRLALLLALQCPLEEREGRCGARSSIWWIASSLAKDADAGADMEERERAIDRLVYDFYGLTAEESAAVERALGRADLGVVPT